jgi:serine-type D-Ala-D-Ala carboxypeptidase/endopeptidase (penicillin-binding protein 4)
MRPLVLFALIGSPFVASALPAQAPAPGPRLPAPRTTPLRGSLERRITTLIDASPFDRASWGIHVVDDRGRVLFSRNPDRYFIPASNIKLVVSAAAAVLLPADYRVRTSLYQNGPVDQGILRGDLVLYGRGDPTFSGRCYGLDSTAVGACDSLYGAIEAMAESVWVHGIRRITGAVVGDGSYFEPTLVHPGWETFDVNWWYAAPVSGLGFNDNSVDFRITPADSVGRPPTITWTPDFGLFLFENRATTAPADSPTTIGNNFFREPGDRFPLKIWAEGAIALGRSPRTESFALPDPNYYAARALYQALLKRGISVGGGVRSTTDSTAYRTARELAPISEFRGRPLPDLIFPILNTSQNWFAEMLLKMLGREPGAASREPVPGGWDAGLEVERRFLVDSVKIDSTAFSLSDGSGLSSGNLVTPRAFTQLLAYMRAHPKNTPFMAALPLSGQPGSLRRRFVGTPLEGRVRAKTGSIFHVNSLSGYIEKPDGRVVIFSIQANSHTVPGRDILSQIDSVVVEIGKTR